MNDLYQIITIGENFAVVHLNAASTIYAAHFPHHPITPGACIVQMALELTEKITDRTLEITEVKNIKFISALAPEEFPEVAFLFKSMNISDDTVEVKIEVANNVRTFTKLSFVCKNEA